MDDTALGTYGRFHATHRLTSPLKVRILHDCGFPTKKPLHTAACAGCPVPANQQHGR